MVNVGFTIKDDADAHAKAMSTQRWVMEVYDTKRKTT